MPEATPTQLLGYEYAVVPREPSDYDSLKDDLVNDLLACIGLRPPSQGEIYWRVPAFLTVEELQASWERFAEEFKRKPNDTAPVLNAEENEKAKASPLADWLEGTQVL
eukprot:TRINITY_DN25327_c0_g1_i1.p1 TRINITY_DN25327_c0_g1~~TRINITY_DN25327_c0_g1_i1.p1  ORF type:complete len:108 (-),score=17.32 TRINITY_DN25327_c0_g1_i1:9-332(-)